MTCDSRYETFANNQDLRRSRALRWRWRLARTRRSSAWWMRFSCSRCRYRMRMNLFPSTRQKTREDSAIFRIRITFITGNIREKFFRIWRRNMRPRQFFFLRRRIRGKLMRASFHKIIFHCWRCVPHSDDFFCQMKIRYRAEILLR